jgi:hypothetical protein
MAEKCLVAFFAQCSSSDWPQQEKMGSILCRIHPFEVLVPSLLLVHTVTRLFKILQTSLSYMQVSSSTPSKQGTKWRTQARYRSDRSCGNNWAEKCRDGSGDDTRGKERAERQYICIRLTGAGLGRIKAELSRLTIILKVQHETGYVRSLQCLSIDE